MDTDVVAVVRTDLKGSPRPSFRDMVAGRSLVAQKDNFISDLDVDSLDEDVVVNNSGVFLEIRFSDRVHQHIDAKLSKSLIVHLLGRSIGYRALKNRVIASWLPMGEVSIVDLDNDYYLIRFAMDADYDKVLTSGPWMVYGCYLTVQPWSRNFSTSVTQPNQILAWIHLPGLPYRYYSKSLFRAIAGLLGHVVHVDFNTDEGVRGRFARLVVVVILDKPLVPRLVINGMYQAIEYEGFPVICFGCGKYGHTKVVNQDILTATGRSRFNVLNVEDGDNHQSHISIPQRESNIESRPTVTPSKDPGLVVSSSHSISESMNVVVVQQQMDVGDCEVFAIDKYVVEDKPAMEVSNSMERDTSVTIAAKDKVVSVPSSLKLDKHEVVRVIDETQPRNLPRKEGRAKKNNELDGEWIVVTDWALSLFRSLSKKGELVSNSTVVSAKKSVETSNVGVQWIENSTFEGGSRPLQYTHAPNILAILEPRVEATGFSGVIWVMWKETIHIDVVVVSNQFVHGLCLEKSSSLECPWVLGGDFNAICSSEERQGGSLRRLGLKSDHSSLVLSMDEGRVLSNSLPFWVLNAWNDHRDFARLLSKGWDENATMFDNLISFQVRSRIWNREVFDHIGQCKSRILARLKGVELALERRESNFLVTLEAELHMDLLEVLEQEESLWHQKSRSKWISHGDRNTKYFHASTLIRRRRNTIPRLRISDGDWCVDEMVLRNHAIEFFKHLFTSEHREPTREDFCAGFQYLPDSYLHLLTRLVSSLEIHLALFSMDPRKSPGVDGFNAGLFQRNWCTVGNSVISFVRIFLNGILEGLANRTLLVLLPKVESPENFKQFRPISLCTVMYKIITKEVIHSMKGSKTWMAIKVDLEKAYDRLEWSFIEETLQELNLPPRFIGWIMYCVRLVSTQIMWNGEVTECFSPSRGIHQGDPLSPYLFVLCMERLSHAIGRKIDVRQWRGIRLSRSGPMISHLFFADDLVLFAEASSECGQNTNFYLGVPLLHKRVTKETYRYLLDRIEQRLSGWAARTLSLAGKITLAKVVLQALPTYVMQTTFLPKGICDAMERLICRFVWGFAMNATSLALVKLPPADGGLGLRDLLSHNKALLMKIGFHLIWNDVCQVICWQIGDGWSTDFWWDVWLDGAGPLAAHCLLSAPPSRMPVASFITISGEWDWNRLICLLPMEWLNKIACIVPPRVDLGSDKPG
ncbi:hypothetical protein GQ457_17G009160 [Hibiscus cannabinus]